MYKLTYCNGREGHSPEVNHFISCGVRIESHPYRELHPGVCNENPQCRKICPDCNEPGGDEVCIFADLVPSEKHNCKKSCFKEKCQNSFYRKRGPKYISNKP